MNPHHFQEPEPGFYMNPQHFNNPDLYLPIRELNPDFFHGTPLTKHYLPDLFKCQEKFHILTIGIFRRFVHVSNFRFRK